ncbi:MAG TPA: hypothetical protein VH141_28470 [Pseudonocardia sp.]|jgi:uncharacterized membrane protein|nr:hypothetical protein [Pseudonocardia sp.]
MAELVAVRYRTYQSATEGCDHLAAAIHDGFVSARAVAIVWLDRKGRRRVRQGLSPYAQRRWGAWFALSAMLMHGGPVDLVELHRGAPVPDDLDESLALDIADGLRSGEAAVVVELAEPTPLLVVEVLRVHGLGLLRTTLPTEDQALMCALFESDHFA